MCMDILSTYVSVYHVPGASQGKKRTLDPLEQESGIVVSHHVGPGN